MHQRLLANFRPLPIELAIEQLTQYAGLNEGDVTHLASTTAEEFYQFFESSNRPRLVETIKILRLRLAATETGKSVLIRVDEALRRLAKRSKLDEMRVRMTELDLSLVKSP